MVRFSVMPYFTYILASRRNGTLYVGVTNNLARRVYEHKTGVAGGFTKRHGVKQLVHYEIANTAEAAIRREKTLKGWNRAWKLALIEKSNPDWHDLYETLSL